MYRIELRPGEETVFRTIEELAVAVRNGLVTSRARIYHNASQKWLPVEFHPHYKRALELQASKPDLATARPTERPQTLSFAVQKPSAPEPPAEPVMAAPASAPAHAPAPAPAPARSQAPVARASEPAAPRARASTPFAHAAAASSFVVREDEVSTAVAGREESFIPEPLSSRAALPPVVASPVLQLPKISYASTVSPAATPVDEPAAAPAAHTVGGRRPLRLVGLVALLSLGAYGAMSAFFPGRGDAAAAPALADRPIVPSEQTESEDPAAAQVTTVEPAAPALPAVVTMTQPASSGFAPALEPRAIVSTPSPKAPGAPAGAAKDSSIAPAPAAPELELPTLPGAELLTPAPRVQRDSAMQRILKAVSGGKDAAPRP